MTDASLESPDEDSEFPAAGAEASEAHVEVLRELVAHLRQKRTQLREEWARRITSARFLTDMTTEEIRAECSAVYDNYLRALETGSIEALQAYAQDLSERIIPRGVETHEVVGIVLLLRDVLARSLFAKYGKDRDVLYRVLDAYEPAANRIANTVAVGFVQERERIIRQQQEAIRELPTPVLRVRERLLILPIVGIIDPQRSRQLTEQLLRAIRVNRAKVVVMDLTGVPEVGESVANHLVQTVEASGLVGAEVIVTGLSPELAQTLVAIGVDLTKMAPVGDLQGASRKRRSCSATRSCRSKKQSTEGATGVRTHSQAGRFPDRLGSGRSERRRSDRPPSPAGRGGRHGPGRRRHPRCHGDGRDGFLFGPHLARNRPHDSLARCGDGDRGDPAGSPFAMVQLGLTLEGYPPRSTWKKASSICNMVESVRVDPPMTDRPAGPEQPVAPPWCRAMRRMRAP